MGGDNEDSKHDDDEESNFDEGEDPKSDDDEDSRPNDDQNQSLVVDSSIVSDTVRLDVPRAKSYIDRQDEACISRCYSAN